MQKSYSRFVDRTYICRTADHAADSIVNGTVDRASDRAADDAVVRAADLLVDGKVDRAADCAIDRAADRILDGRAVDNFDVRIISTLLSKPVSSSYTIHTLGVKTEHSKQKHC